MKFKNPDKHGYEYLTPSAIHEKFGYHEESTWAHLCAGEWSAFGFAEFITNDGRTLPADDTYLPPQLIREILSGLYDNEIRDVPFSNSTIRIKYRKDVVRVLCSPDCTPELFPASKGGDPKHATTTHQTRRRNSHPLANIIETASKIVPGNHLNSIWAVMMQMAESPQRPVPLAGFAVGEGIRYKGRKYQDTGDFDIYTKDALREYLKRRDKKK